MFIAQVKEGIMANKENFLRSKIPQEWLEFLEPELEKEYFKELNDFVFEEYQSKTIYPAEENIFNALRHVAPANVKVVILGQDPYHEPNQAHGLSFSVCDGVALPKSLINIYEELSTDVGCEKATSGNLSKWAEQGVLLLNTVLTVKEHEANSHKGKGWETFTSKILEIALAQSQPKVFILWGKQAENTFFNVYKRQPNVMFIKSAHPSPLSAYRGFFGSKPFSKTNQYFKNRNVKEIDWNLKK